MAYKRHLLNSTALSALFLLGAHAGAAHSADIDAGEAAPVSEAGSQPAVSSINAKIEIAWGGVKPGFSVPVSANDDFDSALKAKGAITIPLAHSFGIQFDGAIGSLHSENYGHAATHLFWRDPAIGLLGGYASYTVWDGVDSVRGGVEGELYSGQFTLSGVIGSEWGDVDNGLFTIANIGMYATENLKFNVGHRYSKEVGNALAAGLEYQFYSAPGTGASFFVDTRLGEHDYQSIFAGLKLYFGEDKSLIRRHREDDPDFHDEDQSVISCVNQGANVVDAIILDGYIPVAQNKACNQPPVVFRPG